MKRFTLSWDEELSAAQFDELCQLSRQYREAQRIARDAEQRYHQRAHAIARPLIVAKLAASGATLNTRDQCIAQMTNEGAANPQPRLTITVSNAPDPGTEGVFD